MHMTYGYDLSQGYDLSHGYDLSLIFFVWLLAHSIFSSIFLECKRLTRAVNNLA